MDSTCVHCGQTLESDDAFCPSCGRPVHPVPGPRPAAGGSPYEHAAASPPTGPPAGPDGVPVSQVHSFEMGGTSGFDPLANSRFGWQLVRHFALFALIYIAADVAAFVICGVLALVGLGFGAAFTLWGIVAVVLWVAVTLIAWLQSVPALLDDQSRLLRNSAWRAGSVLHEIGGIFARQQTPADSMNPRWLTPPGEGRREYLEWQRGAFSCLITCFPFGNDLYVSWTFWIRLTPLNVVLMRIGRMIQNRTGRGNDMYQTLRWDSARAALSAVHLAFDEVTGRPSETVNVRNFAGPAGVLAAAAPVLDAARPSAAQVRDGARA
jgi:hypothetical protein